MFFAIPLLILIILDVSEKALLPVYLLGTLVGTYCSMIVSMVWSYRAVLVYKEKIEPAMSC
jgi:hypothetical protein